MAPSYLYTGIYVEVALHMCLFIRTTGSSEVIYSRLLGSWQHRIYRQIHSPSHWKLVQLYRRTCPKPLFLMVDRTPVGFQRIWGCYADWGVSTEWWETYLEVSGRLNGYRQPDCGGEWVCYGALQVWQFFLPDATKVWRGVCPVKEEDSTQRPSHWNLILFYISLDM